MQRLALSLAATKVNVHQRLIGDVSEESDSPHILVNPNLNC